MIKVFKDKVLALARHRFVRSVALLQSGSIALNLIQAISGVVLTRMLGAEMFGIYTLAIFMASFVSALTGIGVQDTLPAILGDAHARGDRVRILDISAFLLKVVSFIAVVVVVVTFFLPGISGYFYHNPDIGRLAGIIVLASVLSSSFFSLATVSLQVAGRLRSMMFLQLADQTLRSVTAILFVFIGFSIVGAAWGNLIGGMLILLISLVVWQGIHIYDSLIPSLGQLVGHVRKVNLKLFLRFSAWVTLDRNIALFYGILPLLLAGVYVSASEITYFRLAWGFMSLALSLMGPVGTLLNVDFPKTKVSEPHKLRSNFIRVSVYSMGLSTAIGLAAAISSPIVFRILYGKAFLASLPYVYGLVFYAAIYGLGVGLGAMWRALNLVKVSIIINVCTLGVGVPLGIFLLRTYGLWGAVAMVTAWYTISHVVSFTYLIRKLERA